MSLSSRDAAVFRAATQDPHLASDPRGHDTRSSVEAALRNQLAGRPVPPLVLALGLGDGDLLRVLEEDAPETRVLALEPETAAASALQHHALACQWQTTGRLTVLAGPSYEGAAQAWRLFPPNPDDHVLVVHPHLQRRDAAAAVQAARTLKGIVFGARANAEARRRIAGRYLLNTLRNLWATDAPAVDGFDGALGDRAVVIVGAGPTLDETIDDLASITGHCIVVALDTALRPLLARGIAPDFVVAVDASPANARHLIGVDLPDRTMLVSEASIDPLALTRFRGRLTRFVVSTHEPWPWIASHGVPVARLDTFGSVVTPALDFACRATSGHVFFVGLDFAFTHDRPYCRGTVWEQDWARSAEHGDTLDRVFRHELRRWPDMHEPDWAGRTLRTAPHLVAFRDAVRRQIARYRHRRFMNLASTGLLHGDGIEHKTCEDVRRYLKRIDRPSLSGRFTTQHQPTLRADLQRLVESPDPAVLERWRAFSGGGVDAAAIRGALVEGLDAWDVA